MSTIELKNKLKDKIDSISEDHLLERLSFELKVIALCDE